MVIIVIVFLKRDISDAFSRYNVYDDRGDIKYEVIGKHSASGEKINILKDGNIVTKIRDFDFLLLNSFSISAFGDTIGILVTRNSKGISATFRSISWRVRGDLLKKNFDIIDADNSLVCSISSLPCENCTSYKIEVFSENRELFCIASALCFDLLKTAKEPMLSLS